MDNPPLRLISTSLMFYVLGCVILPHLKAHVKTIEARIGSLSHLPIRNGGRRLDHG